ncbi:MAG TPA: PolC-type DNA polymerase III [Negativicutes bacterium]|nr:PolC-type DNA polymerase III [Negativicutes bacterium]
MTYCIAPTDKNILGKLTQQLPLSAAAQFLLRQSRVDKISMDTQTGKCCLVLFVPEELAGDDLTRVTVFLREAICLPKLEIEQRIINDVASICEQKEQLIREFSQVTPLVRRALAAAEWQCKGSKIVITLRRLLENNMLQREEFETKFVAFIKERFGVTVEVEVLVDEDPACYDELDCMLQSLPQDTGASSSSDGTKTGNSDKVILGSLVKGKLMEIKEIIEEQRGVAIQGVVQGFELKELKSGRCLLSFDVSDGTSGINCKAYFENLADGKQKTAALKDGATVKVKGAVMFDKYVRELVVQTDHITKTVTALLTDERPRKRVELHAHTQMSSMDSVVSIEALIRTAEQYGHSAVAITDHGVVQAFPAAQGLARKSKVKVIYGMEGYLFDEDISHSNHIIILARNTLGLRNLYQLVSLAHIKYFHRTPRIPRSALMEFREGLILGSACEAGELYRAMLHGASMDELLRIASFYDYLEIQPCGNNQFLVRNGQVSGLEELQDLNRKVCEIAKLAGKPVAATCDVHFLRPEDAVFRSILMSGQKYDDADLQAPLFFRTTEEMLAEFSYLGEEMAEEVVVTTPQQIADSIEKLQPIPDGLYSPDIPGADDDIRNMSFARAGELYGSPLPEVVANRLKMELDSIINNGFGVLYLIAHKLVKKSTDDGYLVGSRGSVGSSFVATMTGITEVNPLPPHWRCPNCKYNEFADDGAYGGGFDLPDKACPNCGHNLAKDGHNIPFAVFLGFEGDKVPDIDLNFSGDYQAVAHKYTEELFGRDNVFRAGTISTIAERTAYGYVQNYLEERKLPGTNANINRLVRGCAGVKKTTGQHPGGIMVVPRHMDVHHFTPIQHPADDRTSGTVTTHFDYHSISDRLVKLDILGHDDPTVIRMLERLTGLDAKEVSFDDPKTMSLFYSTEALGLTTAQLKSSVGTLGIPEFGTRFVRQMLEETRPARFSELVRISGFSHGTDVWVNNAQDLIRDKIATLSEAISARDDIMVTLIQKGVAPKTSFEIMESVRKGKGVKPNQIQAMKEKNVPEWFIQSCQKIKYMFPRAHAVAYVMMAFRIAWFKVHQPLAFYAAYFTIRAEEFDSVAAAAGETALKSAISELDGKGNGASHKEKAMLAVLETAREMILRGFSFLPVDLYRSDASEFLVSGESLLPPLAALPGLGVSVAESIVNARAERVFSSQEDLRTRGRVSKSLVELLAQQGCLRDLPESDQLRLFG